MRRIEIFLCVDRNSRNPDRVDGLVPFRVDDEILFFGPDQTPLRAEFRKRFFTYKEDITPEVDLYVIGVNDIASPEETRKILWVGRITRLMSFALADGLLRDPRFAPLQDFRTEKEPDKNLSPLHIEPIVVMGNLSGYRHRTDYHDKVGRDGIPDWAKDVVDPRDRRDFGIAGKDLLLRDVSRRKKIFRRDCCFLCENLFFAQGQGMAIGDQIVSLLDQWQPGQGVDGVAIFGYSQAKDGRRVMNKLKGAALHIRFKIAEAMVDYLTAAGPRG
jgi:hypothetical protein